MADEAVTHTVDGGGGEFDARAAAAEISERRAKEAPVQAESFDEAAKRPIEEIKYQDDPKFETRTTRQAAQDLAEYRAQLAARLDGEPKEAAPAAAPAAEQQPAQLEPEPTQQPQTPLDVVAQAEKLIRSDNAEERAAAVKLLGEASQRGHHELKLATGEAYVKEVTRLNEIVATAMLAEYGGVDPAKMAAEDPVRFARLQRLNETYQGLQMHIQAAKRSGEQVQAQQWQSWAESEDAKASKAIPEANDRAFKVAATEALRAYGFQPQELIGAYIGKEHFSLRDARVQRIVADAVRFQQATKSMKPERRPLPAVQRPGVAAPYAPSEITPSDVRSLSSKLGQTGKLKDAAALLVARRRSAQ